MAFQWPAHNFLVNNDTEQDHFERQVYYYTNSYLSAVPPVQTLYNSEYVQNRIFERSETAVRTENGLVCTVYKTPLPVYNEQVIPILIRNLRPLIQRASKVNASVGFIHSTLNLNEYKYKYASLNTSLATHSLPILADGDLSNLAKVMDPDRVYDRINYNFNISYRFHVVAITNIQFIVWHAHYKVGCYTDLVRAHRALMQKRTVWTFPNAPNDGKCFFRALAAHTRGTRRPSQQATDALWSAAFRANLCMPPPHHNSPDIAKTSALETLFSTHIRWYSLDDNMPPVLYTNNTFDTTAHILEIEGHCMLITDVHVFFEQYFCVKCKRAYSNKHSIYRHKSVCNGQHPSGKKWSFLTGPDRPHMDPFEELASYNIIADPALKFTRAFIAYDIECLLQPPGANAFRTKQLIKITAEHIPVSIAVAYSDDPTKSENPDCFVSNGDPAELIDRWMTYMDELYDNYKRQQEARYAYIFTALESRIAKLEEYIKPQHRKSLLSSRPSNFVVDTASGTLDRYYRALKRLYFIKRHFQQLAYRIPVVGYNSSAYDLNAMRAWLIPRLTQNGEELYAVKRRNRYIILSTEKYKFMDIYLFCSQDTNLASFIKAYTSEEELKNCEFTGKLPFPYEAMTSYEILNNTCLPEVKYWLSSMGKYARETDEPTRVKLMTEACAQRASAQQIWEAKNFSTMRDYLVYYNKSDVAPFIKAIRNYAQHTIDEGFDMFQYATLPSLAKQVALASCPTGAYFERFPIKDADLYHQIRNSLYGGASIVWTRHAEADVTKIREHEYGTTALPVKRVIGIDMTACYLWATCQELLTGPYFIRYADNFDIKNGVTNIHSIMAMEYLVARLYGVAALENLTHRYRGGETEIITADYHTYSVDGHLKLPTGDKIIIEYNGCYFHDHLRSEGCTLRHDTPKRFNRTAARARMAALEAYASKVHVICECDWYNMLRQPNVMSFVNSRPLYHTWSTRKGIPHDKIIPLVMQNKLKGIFEIDAYVPKDRMEFFKDICPFYYRDDITFDMIGPTMREQMTSVDQQFKSRSMLVNAPFCQNLLLPHQYVKWLVEHGIVIHKIHKIIEYPLSSSPFYEFGETVCRERQLAAQNEATPAQKARGNGKKLKSNAVYGQFITDEEQFTDTRYVTSTKLKKMLFKNDFRAIDPLADDLYEVAICKDTVKVKQCPQMGFSVYALSKLRMLDFAFKWHLMMDRPKVCLVLTDTDSYYFAMACMAWEDCIRADVTAQQLLDFKTEFFVEHKSQSKYRGLFHIEFAGPLIIVLQPKMYYALGDDSYKLSARGVDKRENTLDLELFRNVLYNPPNLNAAKLVQQSFRVVDNSIVTWRLYMSNLNSFYIKRSVEPNLRDTRSLAWKWPNEFNR